MKITVIKNYEIYLNMNYFKKTKDVFTNIETSFVVDNTNPTRKDRARYIDAAKERGYRVIGYYFQSSISACKERNSRRTGKALLPVSALAATHRTLELPGWDEGFDELYYVRIDDSSFAVEPWETEEEKTDEV